MKISDLRVGQSMSLTGLVRTLDMTNGRDDEDFEMLPEGQIMVTLLINVADQKPQDSRNETGAS